MSNMKDYVMWLDDRGVAKWDTSIGELIIPEGTDVHAPELVDDYHDDAIWHGEDYKVDDGEDDDMLIDEDDDELEIDDGDLDDCVYSPDDYWFRPDGGLTGDAMNFLYTLDSEGEFV